MIRWGEKYKSWDLPRKIVYLEKGWSSSNTALDKMQNARNELLDKVRELNALLEAADQAVQIQKAINLTAITTSNERLQSDAEEIRQLQVRVKAQDKVIEQYACEERRAAAGG